MTSAATTEGAAQPETFAFTAENLERAKTIIARYPQGRQQSAVMPLLDLAQRQSGNWLPRAAMDHVAEMLEMPRIRVYEVASFYTMYNKAPVAKYLVQICRTTPCWLCGCNDLARAVKDVTGAGVGETVGDFTVMEVECLGACVNAPMVQINDDYYEDLDYDRMVTLLEALKRGEMPAIGSQTGRRGSEAASGPTTMLKQRPKPAAPAVAGRGDGDKG
ncbi:MAG: NADH-quinone oxidoreductase subunit NuoE [Rhodospirillaceae bacterium]|nr:NADH-quinone oxidoreductase subunit NuoE [Rhodospirillaceae bacterium]